MPKSKLSRSGGQKAPIKASRKNGNGRVKNPHLGKIPKSTNLTFGHSYSSPSHSSSSSHATFTPKASDVDQGLLGNCYFLATLASIANANPKLITDLIKPTTNDGVLVSLFTDGQWSTIELSDDVPKRWGLGGRKDAFSRGAHWVKMFEKALAHVHGSYAGTQGSSTQGQTSTAVAMSQLGFQLKQAYFPLSTDQAMAVLEHLRSAGLAELFSNDLTFVEGLTNNLTYAELDRYLAKLGLEQGAHATLMANLVNAEIIPGPSGSGTYSKKQLELYAFLKDHIGVEGENKEADEGAQDLIAVAGMTKASANPHELPVQHAYSLLGVVERVENGPTIKYIKLRNPWGHYDKSKWKGYEALVTDYENGEFLIPLDAAGGLSFTFGELPPDSSNSSSSSSSSSVN
ncbi:MAG: hypothetical protein HOW73_28005 [Polyangiaceae bacterium]|nr:hypothetical protein [Polyangiaceae bacterium]